MRIAAVARAFPEHYYPQETLLAAFREHWGQRHHNLDRLEQLHRNVLVGGRHLALPLEEYAHLERWGQANDAWIRVAREIGGKAVREAVATADLDLGDLGALLVVSVTGIATPSLDALIMNELDLPTGLRRVPIFGLGCVAGAAGVARAADFVKAYPDKAAVLLSVELCSLTLQREDLSVPNLISSGLFGDGAACAVITGGDLRAGGPEIVATRSIFYPDTEDVMGWRISERGFQVVLSAEVPAMAREHLGADVEAFLSDHGLDRSDVTSYVCHPGGPKVLEAYGEALGLNDGELALSWATLREHGNISSTSVLLVLQETMEKHRPAPGSHGLMLAMGPGFCTELVLLRW